MNTEINEKLFKLFNEYAGCFPDSTQSISSHGSERKIFRLTSKDFSCIGIDNTNLDENKAFINFAGHFKNHGLNVPQIFLSSNDLRFYLLEDLGNTTLLTIIEQNQNDFPDKVLPFYKTALTDLINFQFEASKGIDYSLCYQFSEFGKENIEFDINYFKEKFLKEFVKYFDASVLDSDFKFLTSKILELPRENFLYRDFQSRNIMVIEEKLYYIDFQSGRKGAILYDVASFLFDAKADLPNSARKELLGYYLKNVCGKYGLNQKEYGNYFWYFVVIRILQALGAYGNLGITKGKKQFLESIPLALKNIRYVLNEKIKSDELVKLRILFNEKINN